MANHADLTDPNLHEVKGAAAASVNTVPVADGAGAAPFGTIPFAALDTSTIKGVGTMSLQGTLTDVSTASSILIPVTKNCTVDKITLILANAITLADSTVTVINSTGAVTFATITVAFTGSGVGTMFTNSPVAFNDFTAGTYMTIHTDGNSTTACVTNIVIDLTLT